MELKQGYKQTEVGVIPEDWEIKQFSEFSEIDPDNLNSNTSPDYLFNYISLEDVDRGVLKSFIELKFRDAPSRARRKIKRNDILVSTVRPNLLSHFLFKDDANDIICSTGFSVVRCNSTTALAEYVFFHLFADCINKQITSLLIGSNYPAINGSDVRRLIIPLPPLPEQRTIATSLSDMDALLAALDELIAKKRLIKQGVMQELLTGKMRLPGISEEWKFDKFEDVADRNIKWSITGGPFGSNLKASDYSSNGVRIIQLQNIGDGVFYDDYAIYTTEQKADELISCNIYPGEIILSKMGDPVARACFVPPPDRRYLMASDGIRLAVDEKRFDKRFVFYYINSVYFRKKAVEASTGSTRQRIGLDDLRALPFPVPPIYEQQAIGTILSDMDSEIDRARAAARKDPPVEARHDAGTADGEERV